MKKMNKKNLTSIAMKTWAESIDSSLNYKEATRYTNHIINKYYNTLDYNIVSKIQKHSYNYGVKKNE